MSGQIELIGDPACFRVMQPTADPAAIGIDRAKNRINGVTIMQLGPVNDSRPWVVDRTTLQQVLHAGNRRPTGLKAHMAHATLLSDGIENFLGNSRNFRIDYNKLRADLHLSDAAKITPNGNLASYVLLMAEKDPEEFGMSVYGNLDFEAMRRGQFKDRKSGKFLQPIRFKNILAADIVDQPAATRDGLFSVIPGLGGNGMSGEQSALAMQLGQEYDEAKAAGVALDSTREQYIQTGLADATGGLAPNPGSFAEQPAAGIPNEQPTWLGSELGDEISIA